MLNKLTGTQATENIENSNQATAAAKPEVCEAEAVIDKRPHLGRFCKRAFVTDPLVLRLTSANVSRLPI